MDISARENIFEGSACSQRLLSIMRYCVGTTAQLQCPWRVEGGFTRPWLHVSQCDLGTPSIANFNIELKPSKNHSGC